MTVSRVSPPADTLALPLTVRHTVGTVRAGQLGTGSLLQALAPVSDVAGLTGTGEAAREVVTHGQGVTVVEARSALVIVLAEPRHLVGSVAGQTGAGVGGAHHQAHSGLPAVHLLTGVLTPRQCTEAARHRVSDDLVGLVVDDEVPAGHELHGVPPPEHETLGARTLLPSNTLLHCEGDDLVGSLHLVHVLRPGADQAVTSSTEQLTVVLHLDLGSSSYPGSSTSDRDVSTQVIKDISTL